MQSPSQPVPTVASAWPSRANCSARTCRIELACSAVPFDSPEEKNMLKRNSMRFAAALLVALASLVAAPNAALAAAPQHHDQVPGFYRLMVGDIEVTALFDGSAVFDPHWLNGKKATMDGVVRALHE